MIRSITLTILAVIFAVGTVAAQTQTKKAPAAVKKPAAASKTAPAKKSTAKTTKKTTAKKTAPKPAADTTKATVPAPAVPDKTEAPKTDTASNPSLKEYTKSKINELGAAKDTLLKSGSDKIGTTKENIGKKLKEFDPFKKSKADTTKSK